MSVKLRCADAYQGLGKFRTEKVPCCIALIKRSIRRSSRRGYVRFYDATISTEAVDGINKFARADALLAEPIEYDWRDP